MSPTTGVLAGLFLLAGAGYVVAAALGRIPGELHVRPWVACVAAAVFAAPGAALLYYGVRNHFRPRLAAREPARGRFAVIPWAVGCVVATGLTVVAAWTAFGPGPREFSGGVSGVLGLVGVGTGGAVSETEGRIAFGIGAVLAGLFTAYGWWYGVRRLLAPGEDAAET